MQEEGTGVTDVAAAVPRQQSSMVSLRDLVAAGIVQPGPGVLCVSRQETTWLGDLLPDGSITADGQTFTSPTQFADAMIQKLFPGRKASNGWRDTFYDGRSVFPPPSVPPLLLLCLSCSCM